jgi:hypothetical protein
MLAFEPETKTLTVGGKTVVVGQLRACDALTFYSSTDADRGFHLIAMTTTVDGEASTVDEVSRWPQTIVNQILPTAMAINGFGAAPAEDEAQAEGNAPRRKAG